MKLLQDIIRLTPFYVTFFWGIIFILNKAKENRARFGLGIFMLTAMVVYFSHAVFFKHDYTFYFKIDGLYMLADLSVYPMYYLYIRLLTKDITFKKEYLYHFIPAILLAVLFEALNLFASPAIREAYLQEVLLHNRWPVSMSHSLLQPIAFVYVVSRAVFGLQSLIYLLLGIFLIRKYNKRIANFYSNVQGRRLAWLEMLTITLILTAVASFLVNMLGRHFFEKHHLLLFPSLIFSILLFVIGFLGSRQNQTIVNVVLDENEEDIVYGDPDNQRLLKEKLLTLMEKEKPFLQPQLRITDLSLRLFTNRTYLSNLINTEFSMNFSDFVNRYRVQHAKALMDKDSTLSYSLNYFSEVSGFGSVSSFIRAFKQFEGTTAGSYHFKNTKKAS